MGTKIAQIFNYKFVFLSASDTVQLQLGARYINLYKK